MEKDALHYIANLKDREKVTHLVQDVPYRVQADGTLGARVIGRAAWKGWGEWTAR